MWIFKLFSLLNLNAIVIWTQYGSEVSFRFLNSIFLSVLYGRTGVKSGTQAISIKLQFILHGIKWVAWTLNACAYSAGEKPGWRYVFISYNITLNAWYKSDIKTFRSLNLFFLFLCTSHILSEYDNIICYTVILLTRQGILWL